MFRVERSVDGISSPVLNGPATLAGMGASDIKNFTLKTSESAIGSPAAVLRSGSTSSRGNATG